MRLSSSTSESRAVTTEARLDLVSLPPQNLRAFGVLATYARAHTYYKGAPLSEMDG